MVIKSLVGYVGSLPLLGLAPFGVMAEKIIAGVDYLA